MKKALLILLIAVSLCFLSACKKSTPDAIEKSYEEILADLDKDTLGASISLLEAFADEFSEYRISKKAKKQVKKLRKQAKSLPRRARLLAAAGHLDRAKKVLRDMETYFPELKSGELETDIYLVAAEQAVEKRNWEQAQSALDSLLDMTLNEDQQRHYRELQTKVGEQIHQIRMAEMDKKRKKVSTPKKVTTTEEGIFRDRAFERKARSQLRSTRPSYPRYRSPSRRSYQRQPRSSGSSKCCCHTVYRGRSSYRWMSESRCRGYDTGGRRHYMGCTSTSRCGR